MGSVVIVDTDPAIGRALRDVDDGLALLYLLAHPERVRIAGVTTVFGNASLRTTTSKAREILRIAGREDLAVYPGAANRRKLAEETPASGFLKETVREAPGEVTVLALGPLTNVATAGQTSKDFFRGVERIIIMGGALDEGLGIPLISPLEFNFFRDPAAADFVLGAECEKVLISADLCRQAIFTRRELDALLNMRSAAATYLAYRVKPWLKLNQLMPLLPYRGGFVPWDVVAALYLIRPDLFGGHVSEGMRIKRSFLATGAVENDHTRSLTPVTAPSTLDGLGVADEFLDAISRFPLVGAPPDK